MLALLGFGIAVAFWPGMAGAEDSSKWVAAFVLLPSALFFVRIKPNVTHWVGLSLLAWADLSLMWTTVLDDGVAGMIRLVVIAVAFLVGNGNEDLRPLYRWFGLGLWLSSVLAIFQWFGYQPVVTMVGDVNPPGLFVNPDLLGEISVLVIVGLIADRSWWIAAGVVPGLLLSQSRAAALALVICGALYAVRRWKWPTLIGIPVLAAVLYAFASNKWLQEPFGGERWLLWRETIHGIAAQPWWGYGVGSFYSTFPKFDTGLDWWQMTWHAHNDVLEFAFELGIPAALIALGLMAALWRRAYERERLVLIAFAVTATFGFPLHSGATAVLFGLVAGHAARGWDGVGVRELLGGLALYQRHSGAGLLSTGSSG